MFLGQKIRIRFAFRGSDPNSGETYAPIWKNQPPPSAQFVCPQNMLYSLLCLYLYRFFRSKKTDQADFTFFLMDLSFLKVKEITKMCACV